MASVPAHSGQSLWEGGSWYLYHDGTVRFFRLVRAHVFAGRKETNGHKQNRRKKRNKFKDPTKMKLEGTFGYPRYNAKPSFPWNSPPITPQTISLPSDMAWQHSRLVYNSCLLQVRSLR